MSSQEKNESLDKFKRRMIRTIARLFKDGKAEDEVWAVLEKEIGEKAKSLSKLWERMRILTIKKLKRLLQVGDRVDLVPQVARMSLTDWLLVDLVIVHEKVDLIDRDNIKSPNVAKLLLNLLTLVQMFDIEGRVGNQLADAWMSATVYYNSKGHQVSPMLLQRRWYQIKELTRQKFYSFWFSYRGNARQLDGALPFAPSDVEISVATKYPCIVTEPFIEWLDLIQQEKIVMPETFEEKILQVNVMKPSDLSIPDVEIIEQHIETIDLSDEDDSVSSKNNEENDKPSEKPVETDIVKVKTEPMDIEENPIIYTEDLAETNDFDEEIERLQIAEMEILKDGDADEEETQNEVSKDPEQSADVIECSQKITEVTPEEITEVISDEVTEVLNDEISQEIIEPITEKISEDKEKQNEVPPQEPVTTNPVNESDENVILIDDEDENLQSENEIDTTQGGTPNENFRKEIETTVIKVENPEILNNDSELVMPIIACVTGAPVEIDDAEASDIQEIENNDNRDSEPKCDSDSSSGEDIVRIDTNSNGNAEDKSPTDINFDDNDIEFVDDGIAYVEEDNNCDIEEIHEDNEPPVRTEVKESNIDDTPKIDMKLLLYPVVYTTKLDDMNVYKNRPIDSLVEGDLIPNIIEESKPVNKKLDYKYELQTNNSSILAPVPCDSNDLDESDHVDPNKIDDAFENNTKPRVMLCDSETETTGIDEASKVKITSYLLRKPRNRSYHPIQLCKNPDFNTALKRLPVSFFCSMSNRLYLRECKPLTIDLSKAFEKKLINGTIYLKSRDIVNKVNEDPVVPIETLNEKVATQVIPSPLPMQNLMEVDQILQEELRKRVLERNKVIKLPDISEVRRINQQLLTAHVPPMRVETNIPEKPTIDTTDVTTVLDVDKPINIDKDEITTPDVISNDSEIVKENLSEVQNNTESNTNEIVKDNSSEVQNKTDSNTNVNTSKLSAKDKEKKKKFRSTYRPTWYNPAQNAIKDNSYLTIDTMFKIIAVLQELGLVNSDYIKHLYQTQQKKNVINDINTIKSNEGNPKSPKENVKQKPEKKKPASKKPPKCKAVVVKSTFCCWANEKIQVLSGVRKRLTQRHLCPRRCDCCCKIALSRFHLVKNKIFPTSEQDVQKLIQSHPLKPKPKESETEHDAEVRHCQMRDVGVGTDEIVTTTIVEQKGDVEVEIPVTLISNNKKQIQDVEMSDVIDLDNDTPIDNVDQVVNVKTVPQPPNTLSSGLLEAPAIRTWKAGKYTYVQSKDFKHASTNARHMRHNRTLLVDESQAKNNVANILKVNAIPPNIKNFTNITKNNTETVPSESTKRLLNKKKFLYVDKKYKKDQCPIYLGKNKLLFTDVKIPLNLNENEQPTAEAAINLPAGIQIVFSPDGSLSYSADPKVCKPSDLAAMPSILAALKKQIDALPVGASIHNVPMQPREVIDLVDTPESDPIPVDTVQSGEGIVQEGGQVEVVASDSTQNSELNVPKVEQAQMVGKVAANETVTDNATDIRKDEESISNVNRKSLLSDLMQMSGISEDDIAAPTVEIIQPTKTVPPPLVPFPEINVNPQISVVPIHTSFKEPLLRNESVELYTINSYLELKYAYKQNGTFYKLDTKTGIVNVIKVCIKKAAEQYAPTMNTPMKHAVIDLTDDVDEIPNSQENALKQLTPVQLKRVKQQNKLNLKQGITSPLKKRVRKQNLKKTSLLNNYLTNKTVMSHPISDGDSSDDEPLVKKIRRKKDIATPKVNENDIGTPEANENDVTTPKVNENVMEYEVPIVNNDSRMEFEVPIVNDDSILVDEDSQSADSSEGDCSVVDNVNGPRPTHLLMSTETLRKAHHIVLDDNVNDDSSQDDCILGV